MKTYALPLIGTVLGGVIAFWASAMLFNTPVAKLFPGALLPLGLAAVTSFVLAWVEPARWKLLAALVALPTVLIASMLFAMLWTEGRNGWSWVLVAGAAVCVCVISSWLAHARRSRGLTHHPR